MGYSPRQFLSGHPYEITMRTSEGLPFVCSPLNQLLVESALARANRDDKVIITHMVWMANHVHLMVICRDHQGLAT